MKIICTLLAFQFLLARTSSVASDGGTQLVSLSHRRLLQRISGGRLIDSGEGSVVAAADENAEQGDGEGARGSLQDDGADVPPVYDARGEQYAGEARSARGDSTSKRFISRLFGKTGASDKIDEVSDATPSFPDQSSGHSSSGNTVSNSKGDHISQIGRSSDGKAKRSSSKLPLDVRKKGARRAASSSSRVSKQHKGRPKAEFEFDDVGNFASSGEGDSQLIVSGDPTEHPFAKGGPSSETGGPNADVDADVDAHVNGYVGDNVTNASSSPGPEPAVGDGGLEGGPHHGGPLLPPGAHSGGSNATPHSARASSPGAAPHPAVDAATPNGSSGNGVPAPGPEPGANAGRNAGPISGLSVGPDAGPVGDESTSEAVASMPPMEERNSGSSSSSVDAAPRAATPLAEGAVEGEDVVGGTLASPSPHPGGTAGGGGGGSVLSPSPAQHLEGGAAREEGFGNTGSRAKAGGKAEGKARQGPPETRGAGGGLPALSASVDSRGSSSSSTKSSRGERQLDKAKAVLERSDDDSPEGALTSTDEEAADAAPDWVVYCVLGSGILAVGVGVYLFRKCHIVDDDVIPNPKYHKVGDVTAGSGNAVSRHGSEEEWEDDFGWDGAEASGPPGQPPPPTETVPAARAAREVELARGPTRPKKPARGDSWGSSDW